MNPFFNTNYSTSNPFGVSSQSTMTSPLESQLAQSYAQLEALRARQTQQDAPIQNTVLTEISNEFNNISDDEANFIKSSQEYQNISLQYQTEFSQFLLNKFSGEYLQSGNGKTLEEMLFIIRKQKDKYKQKFATDINEIRDQNKNLLSKNNELSETNLALQKQLKQIQERLALNE